ncbi:MAG: hypothetical protein HYZ42_14660 [Bacteroidetes bacterium]|nr:hypothetical protein [Bacteroidota bacterium]
MTQIQENYIIIENISTKEIEEILMELANLYSDTGYTHGLQLYQKKGNDKSFLICFTNSPDFERFNYFVNYIHYPEKGNPKVKGFYKVTDIDTNAEYKKGHWILVFVSKTDEDYDNVIIVNENHENFLLDFGDKIKKLETIEESFKLVSVSKEDYNHIIDINPSPKENESKPWWKFW